MPIVSRFLGIVIAMYWNDHAPAHFHVDTGRGLYHLTSRSSRRPTRQAAGPRPSLIAMPLADPTTDFRYGAASS